MVCERDYMKSSIYVNKYNNNMPEWVEIFYGIYGFLDASWSKDWVVQWLKHCTSCEFIGTWVSIHDQCCIVSTYRCTTTSIYDITRYVRSSSHWHMYLTTLNLIVFKVVRIITPKIWMKLQNRKNLHQKNTLLVYIPMTNPHSIIIGSSYPLVN